MFQFLVFSLIAALCYGTPVRIIGGVPADIEDYPSLVQLEAFTDHWSQICGASILNNMYVLSAAQCTVWVFDPFYHPEHRRIRAGTANRQTGGSLHLVTKVYNHPDFDPLSYKADISVIRLGTSLVYGPRIQPATVIVPDYEVPDGMPVVNVGWGATTFWETKSPVLQEVTVYTINNTVCADRFLEASGKNVTEDMICTGILDIGGKGVCNGDAGGPVFFRGVIVGVSSWALICADGHLPAVSTKVSPYTRWISATAV